MRHLAFLRVYVPLERLPERLHQLARNAANLSRADIEAEARNRAGDRARAKAARAGKTPDEQDDEAQAAAQEVIPKGRTQRNFTDPSSRMMKTNHGFDYAYNAQAYVDEAHQVIIATDLTAQTSDVQQLIPMNEVLTKQLRLAGITDHPKVHLADAGYCSEANLTTAASWPGTVLIATGRQRRGETFHDPTQPLPRDATAREVMAHK